MGPRAVVLVMLLVSVSCGLMTSSPPGWVDTLPQDEGWVYAVGAAGRNISSNPGRAREIAYQRAIEELGRSIRVHVQSQSVLTDRDAGTSYLASSEFFSEEDLEQVEIVESWAEEGRDGKAVRTYVLVRMPRNHLDQMRTRLGG